MIFQLIYDVVTFKGRLKQWEYEYYQDIEIRKQKAFNTGKLNEKEIQENIADIIANNVFDDEKNTNDNMMVMGDFEDQDAFLEKLIMGGGGP